MSQNETAVVDGVAWRARAWRACFVGLLMGLLPLGAIWALVHSWGDRLPPEIVNHWNAEGIGDGTASVTAFMAVILGIGAGCVLLFALFAGAIGRVAMTRRVCVGCAAGIGIFMAGTTLTALLPQLDSPTDLNTPLPILGMLLTTVAALAYGFVVALFIRKDPKQIATAPVPASASRLDRDAALGAVWVQTITGGLGAAIGYVAATFTVITGVVLGFVLSSLWLGVLMVFVGVLVLVLVFGFTQFTVSVSAAGLTARSRLGWPKLTVPANEVEQAEVVATSGLLDFGGYGYRTNLKGEIGIITHDGAALKVLQVGGRVTYITVNNAEHGAALLNSYAALARTKSAT